MLKIERDSDDRPGWLGPGRHSVRFVDAKPFNAGASEGVNLHFKDDRGGRARASCHLSSAAAAAFFKRFLDAVCDEGELDEFYSGDACADMRALLAFAERLQGRALDVDVESRGKGPWHEVRRFHRVGAAGSPPSGAGAGEGLATNLAAKISEIKEGSRPVSEAGEYKATIADVPLRIIKGREQPMLRLRTDDGETVDAFLNRTTVGQIESVLGEFTESSIGERIGVCVVMTPGSGAYAGRTFQKVVRFMDPGDVYDHTRATRKLDFEIEQTPEERAAELERSRAAFDEQMREIGDRKPRAQATEGAGGPRPSEGDGANSDGPSERGTDQP